MDFILGKYLIVNLVPNTQINPWRNSGSWTKKKLMPHAIYLQIRVALRGGNCSLTLHKHDNFLLSKKSS
jgi:hypothetical protein